MQFLGYFYIVPILIALYLVLREIRGDDSYLRMKRVDKVEREEKCRQYEKRERQEGQV